MAILGTSSVDGDLTVSGSLICQNMIDTIYPVGSIYMSVNNIDPSTLWGGYGKH